MHLSLKQLYDLYEKMSTSKNYKQDDLDIVKELIHDKEKLIEDTSSMGGPSVSGASVGFSGGVATSGMGPVSSSQPSAFPGALNGTNWINGGGQSGSGDISVPFNPSGSNRVFQKVAAPQMGKNHGAKTGKKSREKRVDLKALKNIFNKKQDYTMGSEKKVKNVMNFNDFAKSETTKVTKVKEGVAFKTTKKKQLGMPWDPDRKEAFREKIENYVKSLGVDCDQVGNDFELVDYKNTGKVIGIVMFRDNYVGIRPEGAKFVDEFEYSEFGKIKAKLSDIIKGV